MEWGWDMGWGPFGHVWAPLWMCSWEEEQGKETGESEVYSLWLWMVKSRLGWAGKQEGFCPSPGISALVQAGALFPRKLFWILSLQSWYVLSAEARKRQGREGSLALKPLRMKFLMNESFT